VRHGGKNSFRRAPKGGEEGREGDEERTMQPKNREKKGGEKGG